VPATCDRRQLGPRLRDVRQQMAGALCRRTNPANGFHTPHFSQGKTSPVNDAAAHQIRRCSTATGSFTIAPTEKPAVIFRSKGRFNMSAGATAIRRLRRILFKAGSDSPENLLAYADFDGTLLGENRRHCPRQRSCHPRRSKPGSPHARDWSAGDPAWKDGKGKGLIGALTICREGLQRLFFPHHTRRWRRRRCLAVRSRE